MILFKSVVVLQCNAITQISTTKQQATITSRK